MTFDIAQLEDCHKGALPSPVSYPGSSDGIQALEIHLKVVGSNPYSNTFKYDGEII